MHTKLATKKQRTIRYKGSPLPFLLQPGRFLDVGDTIQKGDIKIWTNAAPESVESHGCVERGFGPGEVVKDTVVKNQFFRPSKKRAKKAKKTPKSSTKYTILKPEDVIQEGDVWDGTKGCKNVLCDKSFFGSNVAGLKQSFPWRVYKRPPVKNPMSGSRVAFDLSTLPELIGEGTILDRQLGDNDDWLVWLDKPVLGQNVLTIPKKFFKVK
jgi:hypothetical protein